MSKKASLLILLALCCFSSGCSTIKNACDQVQEIYERERDAGSQLFQQTKDACKSLQKKEQKNNDADCDGSGSSAPADGAHSVGTASDSLFTDTITLSSADALNFNGAGDSYSDVSSSSDAQAACESCSGAAAICASLGINPSPDGPLARCCGGVSQQ